MSFSFKENSSQVLASINRKSDRLAREAKSLMSKMGADWEREMVIGQFTGYYDGKTVGNKLRNRTGSLRSSIKFRVVGGSRLGSVGVQVMAGSSAAGYARLQETGKPSPIKPRKRKYLRIPLKGAMTGAGVVRAENKPVRSGAGWKTVGGKRTFVRENNGQAIVYRADGGDKITPLFLLKGSVKVKPRLGMEKNLKKVMKRTAPDIADNLAKMLRGNV